jgi:hypothetical protein
MSVKTFSKHPIVGFALLCTALLGSHAAVAAGCYQRPYSCLPAGDIDPATPGDYKSRYRAYADFVWQDFLALNFPAATDGSGNPLPAPSVNNGLDYNGGNYTTVWMTYPEARDIWLPKGVPPAAFGTGHEVPAACAAIKGSRPNKVLRRGPGQQALEYTMVLDEYVQANRMGPVIDAQGAYVRYGINFNRQMYDYVVNNVLYNKEGQLEHDRDNPNRDLDTVKFPRGAYGAPAGNPGSIFVKSSWKILAGADDPTKFLRTEVYLYDEEGGAFHDEPTVQERCVKATVGLVGLHVVHLSNSAPQWVWATFEHVSNAPWMNDFKSGLVSPTAKYSFFDARSCTAVGGQPGCNYNYLPPLPWNPQVPGQPPTQLVRVAAPGEVAIEANAAYNQQLQQNYGNTVWANYYLTDVQFPTVVKATGDPAVSVSNPAYPDGVQSPSQLANSTLETYIQGFHYGQITSNGNVIPPTDQMQDIVVVPSAPVSPFAKNVYNQSGGAERVTSSCIGCHSDSAMTTGSSADRVFALDRAQSTGALRRQAAKAGVKASASGKAADAKDVEMLHKYLGTGGAAKGQ